MKFTEREATHIKNISNELIANNLNIVRIVLNDGSTTEGVVRRIINKTNQYYAVIIETLSNQKFEINYLDIKFLKSIFDIKKEEYIKAGLIEIVDLKN